MTRRSFLATLLLAFGVRPRARIIDEIHEHRAAIVLPWSRVDARMDAHVVHLTAQVNDLAAALNRVRFNAILLNRRTP